MAGMQPGFSVPEFGPSQSRQKVASRCLKRRGGMRCRVATSSVRRAWRGGVNVLKPRLFSSRTPDAFAANRYQKARFRDHQKQLSSFRKGFLLDLDSLLSECVGLQKPFCRIKDPNGLAPFYLDFMSLSECS